MSDREIDRSTASGSSRRPGRARLALAGALVVLTAAALVAAVVTACTAQTHGTRTNAPTATAPSGYPAGPAGTVWLGDGDWSRDRSDAIREGAPGRYLFSAAPEFELTRVLQNTGQGAGGSSSPFREGEAGSPDGIARSPLAGDIAQDGEARLRLLRAEAERAAREYAARLDAAPLGIRDREELWVIAKCPPPDPERPALPGEESIPGSGCLVTVPEGSDVPVPVPLRHTDVKASVLGYVSTVEVTQQFENPYGSKIEAVYVFPLPENAAVSDFVMTIGERTIRGIIREREQAERIYAEARAQGYVASLLTQERPNIFTQRVANIEPRRRIDVSITYFNALAYADGAFEFVFPMVVGPRYNPPGTASSGDGVGAVASGATGASGQRVEVPYLRPPTRSTHDISLSVEIDAGVPIERLESPSHVVSVERTGKSTARVRLSASDSVPNKDFVLRAHVAGDSVRTALLTHDEGTGGYFTMLLVPPADVHRVARGPLEVVFVLDASGSMQGGPISQAKAAAARGLQRLRETDTFQVINFANSASALGAYPIEATPANVARGVQHLEEVQAAGGTEMIHGIRGALAFPHDPTRLRYVVFLTDGFIGNETDILRETHARLGASRVFSFGVGSSTNRYLMDSMARMGQGAAAYLGHQDSPREVMDLFFDRVERAALTDIRLDFGRATVRDVYPSRLPDVFVGRPVVIVGRYEGDAPRSVSVTGRVGGREVTFRGESRAARGGSAPAPLPRLWARARITELAERSAWDPDTALPAQVRDVALTHGLMSPYTAFIAVDSSVRTQGAYGTTVPVPVPVPQGVRYETTVGP